mgnify:CR=1 FL=1
MLKQRVITAVLLLAILLPCLFATTAWPFAVLTLIMIAAAGWEWARLNGQTQPLVVGAALATVAAVCWSILGLAQTPSWVWWLGMLIWVLGGAQALRSGVQGWPLLPQAARLALGLIALLLTWLAINAARARGINFLLSTFCLVWAADIAAYFGGKAFGMRKLAPAISPGKSWEGVWSGMAGVMLLAVVWVLWIDEHLPVDSASFYQVMWQNLGLVPTVLVLVFMCAMSVVGDLTESLVKRAGGAKDSSHLLPGHGGVLDRIDALLPTLPIALALASI